MNQLGPIAGAADERTTPMMTQYLEIKAAHPDCLLFYRMGDFYELFFGDADTASAALGIALTRRGKHLGADIAMCGVPVHAADDYLERLIRLGHRVAVCEQMEDPVQARRRGHKSVVRRGVVRLVTPGTLTEDTLLEGARANYLAALARVKGDDSLALAWADISSGELRVLATAADRLPADLARIEPREIVLPDSLSAEAGIAPALDACGAALVPLPASRFDSLAGERRLLAHWGVAALDGFGAFSRAEIAALGGLVDYIVLTQAGKAPLLRPPVREEPGAAMAIDAATRANLELTRSLGGDKRGSLLAAIDRTVSAAGARLLAQRLATPLTDPQAIDQRLDEVAWLHGDSDRREALRAALRQMPDLARALARLTLGRGGPRDLGAIRQGLRQALALAELLNDGHHQNRHPGESRDPTLRAMTSEALSVAGLGPGFRRDDELGSPANIRAVVECLTAVPLPLLESLDAALGPDLPLNPRDGGFVKPGRSRDLDEQRSLRDETRHVIAGLQADYAAKTGVKSLKVRHNNIIGYYIEVQAPHAAALQAPEMAQAFIHRQTVAQAMRFTTLELSGLESRIAAAADRALALEQEIFATLLEAVTREAMAISAIAAAAAALDVAAALAELAETGRHVRPRVDSSLAFAVTDGRHPVVEAMLREAAKGSFVANSCDLSAQARRIVLLTGPNMAGKSTYLRQNALIAILAQMGSFVPAAAAHIGIVDRLFSRVGAADDLARGRSTFMVEMVETAAILNRATERSFVILDEIGRGTATFDGLSIAWATIEHLHETNRCRALFATHYHELTALSARLPHLANATVKVREWQGDVVFLHEVAPGVADRSYGIQVAKLAGLPPAVTARAAQVLQALEAGERTQARKTLVDDLPLFSAAARPPPAATPNALDQRLSQIAPDELSPRDALALIYELKALAQSK